MCSLQSSQHATQIIIAEHGECAQCVDGITFPSITLKSVCQSYSFLPSIEDSQLLANMALNITIIDCPMGYGSTGTAICDLCNRGFFNLYSPNSTADRSIVNVCLYCNERFLNGVSCLGASNVIIDFNYWAAIYQFSNFSDLIFDANTSTYIVSHKCPSLYCCQLEEGCNILTDTEYLCAANRDFETPLCGQCKDGYSELFGTSNCGECDRDYGERFLFPLVWGALWALFILFMKSSKPESNRQRRAPERCVAMSNQCKSCLETQHEDMQQKPKLERGEYLQCLEHMVTKIIVYYYQQLSYILTVRNMQFALYGFVDLFNLNILTMTSPSNTDGYCLLKNMDMITKITIQLTTSLFMVFFTVLPFLFGFCRINICCCFKNRRLHFGKSMISVMLICIGQILSVLFKLLACRNIGNLSVHFFFGAQACFDATWIISVICLIIVLLAFFAFFVWICDKLYILGLAGEYDKNAAYYSVISPYVNGLWFWEAVLLIRRTVLAFTFIVFDNKAVKTSICILLLIYSYVHLTLSPFKSKYENKLEGYLIVATVICIFVDLLYSPPYTDEDGASAYSDVVISLLVLLPLVWYVSFMFIHRAALSTSQAKWFQRIEMVDDETDLEDKITMPNGADTTLHEEDLKEEEKEEILVTRGR